MRALKYFSSFSKRLGASQESLIHSLEIPAFAEMTICLNEDVEVTIGKR